MQNDVLKNNVAPWQEKGRWYHLQVECNGSVWKVNTAASDPIFSNSSIVSVRFAVLDLTKKYTPIDIKAILLDLSGVNSNIDLYTSTQFNIHIAASGTSVYLPGVGVYTGKADLYIFMI